MYQDGMLTLQADQGTHNANVRSQESATTELPLEIRI